MKGKFAGSSKASITRVNGADQVSAWTTRGRTGSSEGNAGPSAGASWPVKIQTSPRASRAGRRACSVITSGSAEDA
ncbi:hypothetical protein E8A74_09770 [Polyangium fumosum]|uniref:Uncharacterized protein n=1 Tax=Polyangium fumosum TaxID=889272 RepID=A0A4U1JF65_9BACT|nr:hypothetical protein E8A74_09770 [Polyangium fumosum]